jgi:death-on-curing family protein
MTKTKKAISDQITLYQSEDGKIEVNVKIKNDTIWLSQKQIAELFGTKVPAITKHLNNIYKIKELDKRSSISKMEIVQKEGTRNIVRNIEFYNLDAIISVGYRVNSSKATQFRIWANSILKDYLIKGFAINHSRLKQQETGDLEEAFNLIRQTINTKDISGDEAKGILNIITEYANSWFLLQKYDENNLPQPKIIKSTYQLQYNQCKEAIILLKQELITKKQASNLFGNERSNALKAIIANIYQTFDSQELYSSLQDKAAHLLYSIIKNHPFTDGNKRIGSFLFIIFLTRNHVLYKKSGQKIFDESSLVSLALLIAESNPRQKELLIKLITNLISK